MVPKIPFGDYKKIHEKFTKAEKVFLDELYELDLNYSEEIERLYWLKSNDEIDYEVFIKIILIKTYINLFFKVSIETYC